MLAAMDARVWTTGEGGEPRSFPLPEGRTTVGRDPEAGVPVGDEAVSWHSLDVGPRGGVLTATHLDSRNGPALNGEPLDRPRRLRDGDVLSLGGNRLEVSIPQPRVAGETVPVAAPSVPLIEVERGRAQGRGARS